MSLLDVTGLTIRYGDETVVDGVDLFIERGESVGLVGESGSGKSQTAMAILGLLSPTAEVSGQILYNGNELQGADEEALNAVRAKGIGVVFQDPMSALNPYVRIGRQLREILVAHEIATGAESDERVVAMLARVGLPDPARQFSAYPHELSGGMRQRVMIASALIAEPDLLIADEPTTALDVTVQAQILDLLEEIRDNTALLLITHDLGIVAGHCEHLVVLEKGRVVDAGPTNAVFRAPKHEYTKALIDAAPRIDRGDPPSSQTGSTVLAVESAAVRYDVQGGAKLDAVVDVGLSLRKGETLAVVGESGSGKSSLVHAILGLQPLAQGKVVFAGEELSGLVERRALQKKRNLQLVFQDPMSALNPQMRIQATVEEPLLAHEPGLSRIERVARVHDVMEQVDLDTKLLRRFPHQLSGGQAQRVAIARALILEPGVLVCDEAVASLDSSVREKVLRVLRDAQERTGLSIIFISHDLAVVRTISHRVAVMYMGRLVEVASGRKLFDAPAHPYTRALLEAVPVPDPLVPPRPASLGDEIPSLLEPPPGCVFHPRCSFTVDSCRKTRPALSDLDGSQVACLRATEIN